MEFSLTIPGKLILIGEYAVLQSAPALVAAVNRRVRLTVRPSPDSNWWLRFPHLSEDVPFKITNSTAAPLASYQTPANRPISRIFLLLNEMVKGDKGSLQDFGNLEITIDSSDFFAPDAAKKLGLGFSAALTVGLLASVRQMFNRDCLDKQKLLLDSYRLHNLFQGRTGSGVDIAASVFGGVLCYRINRHATNTAPLAKRVSIPENFNARFVWTGQSASTAEFLKKFEDYRNNNVAAFNRIMQKLTINAEKGCEAFIEGRLNSFLEAIKSYYKLLRQLGAESQLPIISDIHRRIARTVYAAGGFYKPSGAGGGDFGVIFSLNESQMTNIAQQVAKDGFTITDINVGAEGIRFYADEGGINDSTRLSKAVYAIGR